MAFIHGLELLVPGWQTPSLGSTVRKSNVMKGRSREELPTSEQPAKREARDKIFFKGISSLIYFLSSWTPTS